MKNLLIVRELTGGANELTFIPVPCRGTVNSVKVISDTEIVATGWLKCGRGDVATAEYVVNTITVPAGNVAAGTVLEGVEDTTYGDLIFDPDSDTAAHKSIWVETDVNFLGGAGTITLLVEYDDSAYVKQAASEA